MGLTEIVGDEPWTDPEFLASEGETIQWAVIPGTEGLYEASDQGNAASRRSKERRRG